MGRDYKYLAFKLLVDIANAYNTKLENILDFYELEDEEKEEFYEWYNTYEEEN